MSDRSNEGDEPTIEFDANARSSVIDDDVVELLSTSEEEKERAE